MKFPHIQFSAISTWRPLLNSPTASRRMRSLTASICTLTTKRRPPRQSHVFSFIRQIWALGRRRRLSATIWSSHGGSFLACFCMDFSTCFSTSFSICFSTCFSACFRVCLFICFRVCVFRKGPPHESEKTLAILAEKWEQHRHGKENCGSRGQAGLR